MKSPNKNRKLAEDKQSEPLLIRLRPLEKQGFQNAAEIAGVSLTAWVRERLRLAATRELESAGRKIPFLKDFSME